MNSTGIIIGIITFIIIGIFHPIVIKAEYYLGKDSWILFFLTGVVFIVLSLLNGNVIFSAASGVLGFTCLWSIKEVFDQEKRVSEGRYPKNPKRSDKSDN